MAEKYEGLPVNAQFSLAIADEEFQLDAQRAAKNAKPVEEDWKRGFTDSKEHKPN